VAIQSRITLFNMYLKSAEDQREEYKKKHEANVKKMDASQHTLNNNEKLSSTFVQLINERCNNISERIRFNINNMDRQDNVLNLNQQAPRKKCHGNRRDQRFRRKCRAEKMKPAKIKKLIKKRNRFQKKNKKPTTYIESSKSKNELSSSRQNYQSQPIITTNLSKRKQDISSQQLSSTIDLAIPKTTSSISIAQSS
ncbi:unnamed protein product, partial [Rotaria socialis]